MELHFYYHIIILMQLYIKKIIAKEKANSLKKDVTLIFGGDISFDGPVRYYAHRKCSYTRPFKKIKPYFADADMVITNLESPFFDGDPKKKMFAEGKGLKHMAETKSVEGLTYLGVDLVTLANNHMLDAGEEGFNTTINTLKDADIAFVGMTTGKSATARQKPVKVMMNGVSIGFLAYCSHIGGCQSLRSKVSIGQAVFNISIVKQDITDLRDDVDIVVVIIHWGVEYIPVPPLYVRKWAVQIKDFGADLIIGGHPHVLQGHECLEKTLVTYSLGNFLFAIHLVHPDKEFLEGKEPPPDVVIEYENEVPKIYHQSQFSYLLKVKVDRNGIVDARILLFKIESEPDTFCLQPTPVSGKWLKFCDIGNDPYCFDLQTTFAETFSQARTNLNFINSNLRQCIRSSTK